MKNLYAAGLVCCLLFTAFTSFAQVGPPLNQQLSGKPLLFSALPDKFECNIEAIERLFTAPNQQFNIRIGNNLLVEATSMKRYERRQNLTTINMKLKDYHDALFTVSRISDTKGTRFIGRIINVDYGDALELRMENKKYFFVKHELKFMMVE